MKKLQAKSLQSLGYSSLAIVMLTSSGCRTLDRMTEINEVPPVSQIVNPVAHPNYRPVTMPMPEPQIEEVRNNSLWKTGAKTFFKDQRAKRVGDVLTVLIKINDKANLYNETKTQRQSSQSSKVGGLFGFESKLVNILPKQVQPQNLLNLSSNPNLDGKGTIQRTDQIQTKLAATIVQLLPNGNLVISGRQEMRVNYEVRELAVVGVVRPEDISSANTIDYDKVSEARMIYGGRGQLDDVQQAPWGVQMINTLSPF